MFEIQSFSIRSGNADSWDLAWAGIMWSALPSGGWGRVKCPNSEQLLLRVGVLGGCLADVWGHGLGGRDLARETGGEQGGDQRSRFVQMLLTRRKKERATGRVGMRSPQAVWVQMAALLRV